MDLDIVVFWLALMVVAGTFLSTPGRGGWALLTGGIVVAAPVILYFAPEAAPWVVFGVVAVLVVLPALLMRATMIYNRRQNYRAARFFAWLAAILHPMDEWPATARLFGALDLLRGGHDQAARKQLQRIATVQSEIGLAAKSQLCRLDGDWQAVLDDPRVARDSVPTLPLHLRALGETGRRAQMLALFRRAEATLRRSGGQVLAQALLCVAAFGGRPRAVAALLSGPFADSPDEHKRLWTATAQIAAGGVEAAAGTATLRDLSHRAERDTRRVAAARLSRALEDPNPSGDRDGDLLDRLERELASAPAPAPRRRMSRNIVTLGLGAANVAVFVAEWLSGAPEDDATLYKLGALFTPSVVQGGEWWRLLTAMFLHAGAIHLLANMAGLLILGSVVEPMLGRWKYLVLYFGAGIGSMASIVVLSSMGLMQPVLLVGASGAIMGLIGGLGAAALRQWLAAPTGLARQRLIRVGLALVLQTGIDLTTPRISFTAHISGTGIGFAIGWIMRARWRAIDTDGALGAGAPTSGAATFSIRRAILYAIVGTAVAASLWVAAYR